MGKLTIYSDIFRSFDALKGSGLLPDERLDQIKNYIAENQFAPAKLEGGRILKDFVAHLPSAQIFGKYALIHSYSYVFNCILGSFLTEEETEKLYKYANTIWRNRREAENFEKATKLKESEYDGAVYCEGVGYNDGYFESLDDFYEHYAEEYQDGENTDPIKYVWGVNEVKFCQISLDSIIEGIVENSYEDFDADRISGIKKLKEAIDTFNWRNRELISFEPDYSRVILLNRIY